MTLTTTDQRAVDYVRRIRNPAKRAYAGLYLRHLVDPEHVPEPSTDGLSYMGAQSVRIALGNILRGEA